MTRPAQGICWCRVAMQPGVADHDVQRAEMRNGIGKHRLDLVLLAHVRFESDGFAAHALDLAHDLVGRLGMGDVVHDHVRAGACQSRGDRPANAGIGPGDECGLTGEDLMIRRVRQATTIG